jgi:hypothetical protein
MIGQVSDSKAAADGQSSVVDKVALFIASARAATVDGLTWQEFGELMVALLHLTVAALDAVGSMTGDEKKSFAVEAVARLFDALADRAVPIVAYPVWLLARPAIRALVLALAGGAIEQILPLVRLA